MGYNGFEMRHPRSALPRLARKWIDRFNLHDWRFEFEVKPFAEINPPESDSVVYSRVVWDPAERTATVEVVEMATVPPEWRCGVTLEELVVHELLHVVLSGHTAPDGDDMHAERAVRVLTKCLVKTGSKRRKT